MPELDLLSTMAVALALALAGGLAARAVGVSPIVGYLLAGVVISPFTPGYDADPETIRELAELGVIFLMFGVGLHFNLGDLGEVRAVAVPGAIITVSAATAMGLGVGLAFDLPSREALTLGLAISGVSTVVLIRGLEDRGVMGQPGAQLAIGWLIMLDLLSIGILAVLPSLEPDGGDDPWLELGTAILLAAVFVGVMLFVGSRLLPRVLAWVARTGSRELFLLTTIVVALGIATSSQAFGLSVALGAFLAGVVVSETETSHQVAADLVPLREAFAVLFFVSVGMLLDPEVVGENLGLFLAVLAAVVVGNALFAFLTTAASPYDVRTALLLGAGLAQIGEFSFIIADEALDHSLMTTETYNIVLATAVASITLNPLVYRAVPPLERALRGLGSRRPWAEGRGGRAPVVPAGGHAVILGYGRVGELTGHALTAMQVPFVVVESSFEFARRLNAARIQTLWGDAAGTELLRRAGVASARLVIVALPDEASTFVATSNIRRVNPHVPVLVRARSGDEVEALRSLGADEVVVPEYEGGLELMRQALIALGYNAEEALHFSHAMRDTHYVKKESEPHL